MVADNQEYTGPEVNVMPSDVTRDEDVVKSVHRFKEQAREKRLNRIEKNKANRETLNGYQDWSHKIEGQSQTTLPKLQTAIANFSAIVSKGLTDAENWYSVKTMDRSPLREHQIKGLMKCFIDNLAMDENKYTSLTTLISDAVKAGCTDALMIVKIQGRNVRRREFYVEPGVPFLNELGQTQNGPPKLRRAYREGWRLQVDLVPDTDYFPDPTGRGLYEIHSVERDLFEVIKSAEAGVYDKDEVELLKTALLSDKVHGDDIRDTEDTHQTQAERKTVVIDEFWGTLLDDQGNIIYENCVCAVANGHYLIRKPQPNPLWHGGSPFVVSPIVRTPFSVWHRALYDESSTLNRAINELYNLMFDGGIASVWGVRQVRRDLIRNPESVGSGISAGQVIEVDVTTPPETKVVETVSQGQVPQDALAMFHLLDREYQQSALTNDVRLGNLPPRQVKATEIIESQQGQSITIDSILKDIENEFIEKIIRKSWLTVLQFADEIPFDNYDGGVDIETATIFRNLTREERFVVFGQRCSFAVHGLTSTINHARDFQKIIAFMQVVGSNPLLFRSFVTQYSPDKVLNTIMKTLDLNPNLFRLTLEETQQIPIVLQDLQLINSLISGGGNQQGSTQGLGGDATNSEINQLVNPLSGIQT